MDASVGEQGPPSEKCLSQAQLIGFAITQWRDGPGEGYPCLDTPLFTFTQSLVATLPSMLNPVLTPKDGKAAMLDTFMPFAPGETVPQLLYTDVGPILTPDWRWRCHFSQYMAEAGGPARALHSGGSSQGLGYGLLPE